MTSPGERGGGRSGPLASIPKLPQLLLLLSSDQPGEVVTAAHAIGRALKTAGADWHDLAEAISRPEPAPVVIHVECPPARPRPRPHDSAPTWAKLTLKQRRAFLQGLQDQPWLSAWETEFVTSIARQVSGWCPRDVSPKQTAVLDGLLARAWERGGGP